MIFSTLFNSGYLDKGLVLYESLCKNAGEFKLYVFAFDDVCYRIMSGYADDRLIVVSMHEFENKELLEAKKNRTQQEYCWTCSCHTIKYVLEHYDEKYCTYIDADMYFYKNPKILFDEIENSHCDVGIIRHGFIENRENRRYINLSGEFCVEFNTFYNNENGKKVLNWWCEQCLECCSAKSDGIHFGDQKYVEQFPKIFSGVHIIENQGAGVAPWNIARFALEKAETQNDTIILKEKSTKESTELIFYHFQQIRYIAPTLVDINAYMYPHAASKKLRDVIYKPYLRKLDNKRTEIREMFGIDMYAREKYVEKQSFTKYVKELFKYERNIVIFIKRFFRALFQKSNDYIGW